MESIVRAASRSVSVRLHLIIRTPSADAPTNRRSVMRQKRTRDSLSRINTSLYVELLEDRRLLSGVGPLKPISIPVVEVVAPAKEPVVVPIVDKVVAPPAPVVDKVVAPPAPV